MIDFKAYSRYYLRDMNIEQGPQSAETRSPQERRLSLASELLGEYAKGVEPGSARAWAIADYEDIQQVNSDVTRCLASQLEELPDNLRLENDSDLRIAEQTLVGIELRIREHSATL